MQVRNSFARRALGAFSAVLKSTFTLKQPGPMKRFAIDWLGYREGTVTKPYSEAIWVYRCCNAWAKLAQVPVVAEGPDGAEVTKGSLPFLVDSPNADQGLPELLDLTILDLGLRGNAYWKRDEAQGATVAELRRMPAQSVSVPHEAVDPRTGAILWYAYQVQPGVYERVEVERVIHFRLPNPYDEIYGLSPISAAQLSVDADNAARIHNREMMKNHGRIAGILTFSDIIGTDGLRERAKWWMQNYGGNENAGKTVLMDGNPDYKQLSLTQKDLDWLEASKLTREEICAAYAVPPIVVGIFDNATYSNYDAAMLSLWTDTLIPLGYSIMSTLNHWLQRQAKERGKLRFKFETVRTLQEAEAIKIDRYIKLLTSGKVTPRRAAEMTGIDLGEPHHAQEVVWVGFNETPFGETQAQPESNAQDATKAIDFAAMRKALTSMRDTAAAQAKADDETAQAARKLRKARGVAIMREAAPFERKLANVLRTFFDKQAATIRRNAESALSGMVKSHPTERKDINLTPEQWANVLLGDTDWDAALKADMLPTLKAAFKKGATEWLKEVALDQSKFSDEVGRSFLKSQLELLNEVNGYTYEALKAAMPDLLAGIQAGKSVEALMTDLEKSLAYVTDNTEARRQRIARTESLRAINGGRYEEMKEVGVAWKSWLTVGDDDVRDAHVDLDNTVIPITEDFAHNLAYPGDPRAEPGQTINCRCTVLAEMKGPK